MSLKIIREDITRVKADAIVNPTDAFYSGSGGTDKRVHKAAGELLDQYCAYLPKLEVGKAEITSSYGMENTNYIIHTRGPEYIDGKHNERQLLEDCYRNSLELALKKKCKSVAMPLISTGTFGYPVKEAMKVANAVISDFILDNDMDVYLLVYKIEAFDISMKLYNDIKDYLSENGIFDNPYEEEEYRLMQRRNRSNMSSVVDIYSKPNAYNPIEKGFEKNYVEDESFNECLRRFISEKNMVESDVYKGANITKQAFNKIYNEGSIPKKNNVLALALGLKLNVYETEELLNKAGYSFEHDKTDYIVKYLIQHNEYNVDKVNDYLQAEYLPKLGSK